MLLRPTIVTSQPQYTPTLSRAGVFGKSLQQCLIPSLGLKDIVSGETWTTFGTAPTRQGGVRGISYSTPSSSSGGLLLQPTKNIATAAQTHLLVFHAKGVTVPYGGIFAIASSDGLSGSTGFQDTASGYMGTFATSTTLSSVESNNVSTQMGLCVLIHTTDSTGVKTWVNGRLVQDASNPPVTQSNSRIVLFGERVGTASFSSQGDLYLYAGAPVRISDAEAQALSRNPWLLFAQQPSALWNAVAGGGNVSVNLIGTSITISQGNEIPSISYGISGISNTTSTGSIRSAASYGLSGQSVTTAAGTIRSAISRTITGSSVTVSTGSVSTGSDVSKTLSGIALAVNQGTITAAISRGITGQSSSFASGTIVNTVGPTLNGASLTTASGTLRSALSRTLSGSSITVTPGNVSSLSGTYVTVKAGSWIRYRTI